MKSIFLLAVVGIVHLNLQAQTPTPSNLPQIQENERSLSNLQREVRLAKGGDPVGDEEPDSLKSFVICITISKKDYKDKKQLNDLLNTGYQYSNFAVEHGYDRIIIRVTSPGIFSKTSQRVLYLHRAARAVL